MLFSHSHDLGHQQHSLHGVPCLVHTLRARGTFQPMRPSPATKDSSRSSSARCGSPAWRTQEQQRDPPLTWEQSTRHTGHAAGVESQAPGIGRMPQQPRSSALRMMTTAKPLSGVRQGSPGVPGPRMQPPTPLSPPASPPVFPWVRPTSVCPEGYVCVCPRPLGQ